MSKRIADILKDLYWEIEELKPLGYADSQTLDLFNDLILDILEMREKMKTKPSNPSRPSKKSSAERKKARKKAREQRRKIAMVKAHYGK